MRHHRRWLTENQTLKGDAPTKQIARVDDEEPIERRRKFRAKPEISKNVCDGLRLPHRGKVSGHEGANRIFRIRNRLA